MAQYVDKTKVAAEITRLQAITMDEDGNFYTAKAQAEYNVLCMLDSFLDTLEVKEVDLDGEINLWVKNLHRVPNFEELNKFAKHFFELGMCVNNPITAADRGVVEEIILSLKQVENDYRIDHTKEIEWLRNKVKKVE